MTKRKPTGIEINPDAVEMYATSRGLDFHQYSKYHMRLMDGGYTVLDIWTTGRYYVLTTDYVEFAKGTVERGGEKGLLPGSYEDFKKWLDSLFFPEIK